MNSIQRNREIGSIKLILIVGLALSIALIIFAIVHWSDNNVVKRKQAALITSIEKRNRGKIMKLMSEEYSDRWGFNKDQASLACREAGSQFISLVVKAQKEQFEFNDDDTATATATMNLKLSGRALGVGSEILRRANQLKTPWIFTWKKEGFGPVSWKLITIENKSIPDNAYGYRPGDFDDLLNGN